MTVEVEDDVALALARAATAPEVLVGSGRTPLASEAAKVLVRVVVDQHVGLPDTFELTFLDVAMDLLNTSGLGLGTPVVIRGAARDRDSAGPLVEGEVTAIEGSYADAEPLTVVRGCTLDHRLQRARKARTFVNATDSDVARLLAGDAGIPIGDIDATSVTHPQINQDGQSDWQLLRERAEELGYEVGVAGGRFYFRRAATASDRTAIAATVGGNLLAFRPRVSAAGLVPEVEVRAWDAANAQAKSVRKPINSASVSLGLGDASTVARIFAAGPTSDAAGRSSELGPVPSSQAHVVFDRSVTVDGSNTQPLACAADALAEQVASGFAEAEGDMLGDARVVAGVVLHVDGVPEQFCGKWTVSRARHVFDHNIGDGYRTWFCVSGCQDRSLLALAGGRAAGNHRGPSRVAGVAVGVVTAIDDPLGLARVKVALPWLSPDYESTWAPVTQLTAGKRTGALFMPEPGEQVLVAFEFGDQRRPFVVGSVVNTRTGAGGVIEPGGSAPGDSAVKAGHPAAVIRRGFVSPSGNRLVFHDDGPPGGGAPTASQVILATASDEVGLLIDQVAGTLTLTCTPGSPPGTLSIACDGNVEIKAGPTGTLSIDGGKSLTLKGQTVSIEGTGPVAVKGKPIQLN